MNISLDTKTRPESMDALAPDGSEIRLLTAVSGGGMVHCTLPPGHTSRAVRHSTVEEVWYFLEGRGEVWRRLEEQEQVTAVEPGISVNIPLGTHFQFRNTGEASLRFLIVTMPPWPGDAEAVRVTDHWPVD